MPIAWGGSLFNMLIDDAHSTVKSTHLASIIHQITNAVMHCHAQGVFHLDIKVENILLLRVHDPRPAYGPHVCLADFGASCARSLWFPHGHSA